MIWPGKYKNISDADRTSIELGKDDHGEKLDEKKY